MMAAPPIGEGAVTGPTSQPNPPLPWLPWRALVQAARRDPNATEPILAALTPTLRAVAWRLAPRYADDALQAGQIGVWQALDRIDCRRANPSIHRCLVVAGVHAMQDEIRRRVRQNRAVDNSETILEMMPAQRANTTPPTLAGLLEHARDRELVAGLSRAG